jgi:hypothetical protein
MCQRNFNERKARTSTPTFSFSVMLFNKCPITLYTISCVVSLRSVPATFHSTLVFIILCKYIQNISIHHRDLIYVERQTDRMVQLQMAVLVSGEMSVDSPQVLLLLKKMI